MGIREFIYYFLCFFVMSSGKIDMRNMHNHQNRIKIIRVSNTKISRLKMMIELVRTWPDFNEIVNKFNHHNHKYFKNKKSFEKFVHEFCGIYNNIIESLNEMHYDVNSNSFFHERDHDEDQQYKYHCIYRANFWKEISSNYIDTIHLINEIKDITLSFLTIFIDKRTHQLVKSMEWKNLSIVDIVENLRDLFNTFGTDSNINADITNNIFSNCQLDILGMLQKILIYLKENNVKGYFCGETYGDINCVKYLYLSPFDIYFNSALLQNYSNHLKRINDEINTKCIQHIHERIKIDHTIMSNHPSAKDVYEEHFQQYEEIYKNLDNEMRQKRERELLKKRRDVTKLEQEKSLNKRSKQGKGQEYLIKFGKELKIKHKRSQEKFNESSENESSENDLEYKKNHSIKKSKK